MTGPVGTGGVLSGAQQAYLQSAGVGQPTVDLIERVHARRAGGDAAVPAPPGPGPDQPQAPTAPPTDGTPWVDTPDPEHRSLASSHVWLLRHVGVPEHGIAALSASSPHPVEVERYIQDHILGAPDQFDLMLARDTGQPRPIGTTRQLLAQVPAGILHRPDPDRFQLDTTPVDVPHPAFPGLATAHVEMLQVLGYDEAGIAHVQSMQLHPAELDRRLNEVIDDPEAFDRQQGIAPGTTRARLQQFGILPGDQHPQRRSI